MSEPNDLHAMLQERFVLLPKPVQNAITSADVSEKLRTMAEGERLHLDQWESLENEVMLTLFGVNQLEGLPTKIQEHVGVSAEIADTLAHKVSTIIFEPIREQLERELENPNAKAEVKSGVEQASEQALAREKAAAVAPATPPPAAPEEKAVRSQVSESYKTGETSSARKDVHNDPYREPPA